MVWGRPSSVSVKSSLVRLLTILPCLSRTVASTFTTFTWTDIVVTDWSAEFSLAFFVVRVVSRLRGGKVEHHSRRRDQKGKTREV